MEIHVLFGRKQGVNLVLQLLQWDNRPLRVRSRQKSEMTFLTLA